ncbi:centrosomal protein of 78 kDa-like [Ornithodoros turicata]|uniref:centrosomal protein of 78 kDa-like n=1 Tax=Ornithodoros turicata TaxID=34597 RepID=UPI0031397829
MKTNQGALVRVRGAPVFIDIYNEQCQKFNVYPRRAVTSKLVESNTLELSTDVIRSDDWKPLLQALHLDRSLKKIALFSSFLSNYPTVVADVPRLQLIRRIQKDVHIPPLLTPDTFNDFCSSLCDHLKNNTLLKTLSLQGFPFTVTQLQQLASAIHHSKSVTHISLDGCPFGRQHVEAICHGLRGTWKPRVLSLNNCQIDSSSAESLASLLELQVVQLHGEAWKEGSHIQSHVLDRSRGLRRLSLCNNPLGDDGAIAILSALKDDTWLRALDFQNCSIGNSGAKAVLDTLNGKCALEVIDLRRNPHIDHSLIKEVEDQIKGNCKGRKCKFHLLPLEKTSLIMVAPPRMRSRSVGYTDQEKHVKKNHLRSRSEERNVKPFHNRRMKPTHPPSTRMGVTRPVSDMRMKSQKAENVFGTSSAGERKLEEQLLTCEEDLKQEREMRLHSEKLLMQMFEENRHLRAENKASRPDGYVLVETSLLDAVETTFVKFCQFLEIIKKESTPIRPKHLESLPHGYEKNGEPSLHETKGRQKASGAIPKTKQTLNTSRHSDAAVQNFHVANGTTPKRTEASRAPSSSIPTIQNLPPTSMTDRHTSVDASLLQDFISSKAQKLVSELRSKWNRSGSEESSISGTKHTRERSGVQGGVSLVNRNESPSPAAKQTKDSAEKSVSHAMEVQGGPPAMSMLSLSLKEDSKRLSELLNVEQVPSKLAQSLDTSQVFYPLESESAGYKSDDFASTQSASSSAGERDIKRKLLASGKRSRESSTSSVSRASSAKQSSKVPSKDSKAGSAVIKEKFNSLSAAQKCSQNTSIVSSLSEEVASAHTTLSSQQSPSMNIPVTTLSSKTTGPRKEQSSSRSILSFEAAEHHKMLSTSKAELPVTPSVSLSRGLSGSFDFPTADITVSSIDSISKHLNEGWSEKRSHYLNFSTPPQNPRLDRNMMERSDTVRTPSDVTLSRNNSSISTPSSPDTLTSPRLVGSDFDGF